MVSIIKEWQDLYEKELYMKAVADICAQPIDVLKRICKKFDQTDPDAYQLKYKNNETQFECEFSFNDFKLILSKIGKTYEEILNWVPINTSNLSELPPLAY